MLRYYLLAALCVFIAGGCASSDRHKQVDASSYPNLVQLQKPGQTPHRPGKVYIDSVTQITVDSQKALLIAGNFSDGCTHLASVSHKRDGMGLRLKITTWRNTEKMCTQALVPFSYIYDQISNTTFANNSSVLINGQTYTF